MISSLRKKRLETTNWFYMEKFLKYSGRKIQFHLTFKSISTLGNLREAGLEKKADGQRRFWFTLPWQTSNTVMSFWISRLELC